MEEHGEKAARARLRDTRVERGTELERTLSWVAQPVHGLHLRRERHLDLADGPSGAGHILIHVAHKRLG